MSGVPLSERQKKDILSDYIPGIPGHGYKAVADKHRVAPTTVRALYKRTKKRKGDLSLQPKGHRKRKLTVEEERKICRRLDNNPLLTNQQLQASVDEKVSLTTISRTLQNAQPKFTSKKIEDVSEAEMSDEWRREVKKFLRMLNRSHPMANRIYGDETAIYANEARSRGRSRKGKRIHRKREYYAKKFTLHVFIREGEVVAWDLSEDNADDDEVLRVFTTKVLPKVEEHDVLIWDRLGRSGRCRNPVKQHFNPQIKSLLESKGATVLLLPPKGKYLNPVELLNNHLKEHYLRVHKRKGGKHFTFENLKQKLRNYFANLENDTISSFFQCRATGKYLKDNNLLKLKGS
jgi:transposase